MIRALFFDAAGTLMHLPRGAAHHYADVARRHGIDLDEKLLSSAFRASWREMPIPSTTRVRRPDDDRGWWRELVDRTLNRYGLPDDSSFDRDAYFAELYVEFTRPGVWALYPEALSVLRRLSDRYVLGVISNFDGRLRPVLDGLGVADFFREVIISSEVGADKPDPWIFAESARQLGVTPEQSMHIGDEPAADWEGAASAGFHVFQLDRPANTLEDLVRLLP